AIHVRGECSPEARWGRFDGLMGGEGTVARAVEQAHGAVGLRHPDQVEDAVAVEITQDRLAIPDQQLAGRGVRRGPEAQRPVATALLACPGLAGDPLGARVPAGSAVARRLTEIVATKTVALAAWGQVFLALSVDGRLPDHHHRRAVPRIDARVGPGELERAPATAAAHGQEDEQPRSRPRSIAGGAGRHWQVFYQIVVCPSAVVMMMSGRWSPETSPTETSTISEGPSENTMSCSRKVPSALPSSTPRRKSVTVEPRLGGASGTVSAVMLTMSSCPSPFTSTARRRGWVTPGRG